MLRYFDPPRWKPCYCARLHFSRKLIFKFKSAAAVSLSSSCTRARAAFLYSRMFTMFQRDNFHLRLTRGVNLSVHCHPNNAFATKGTCDSRQRGPCDSRGCTREASLRRSFSHVHSFSRYLRNVMFYNDVNGHALNARK